jgi:hypothetical protein
MLRNHGKAADLLFTVSRHEHGTCLFQEASDRLFTPKTLRNSSTGLLSTGAYDKS